MKKELIQLQELISAIAEYFDDKRLVTMSVILQNMAFRADDNKSNWGDFDAMFKILLMNAEFRSDCHVSQWIHTEARMIVDGHFMSQAEEAEIEDKISRRMVDEHWQSQLEEAQDEPKVRHMKVAVEDDDDDD